MSALHTSADLAPDEQDGATGLTYLRLVFVLGLLSALGPIAVDMYLPVLPAIGYNLGAQMGDVQLSLISFFVAMAVSQLVYGPAADVLGRKLPMVVGLGLFVVGSVGCALAPSVSSLVMCRFLQGLGAGALLVVPRAVVRDLYTGNEAARLIGFLMLVFSVSPMLAPLVGSVVGDRAGWRGIFWLVAGLGVAGLALLVLALEESHPPERRAPSRMRTAFRAYKLLLQDRYFMGLAITSAFGMSAFFVYLASSSFVLIHQHGFTPRSYSLAFAVNAVAFFGMAQLTGRLAARLGLRLLVKLAVGGFALTMSAMLALYLQGDQGLITLLVMLFIGFGFLGLVLPAASALALEDHGFIAGTASALMGTVQFVVGSTVMAIVGAFADSTSLAMQVGIAVSACAALVAARLTLGGWSAPGRTRRGPLDPTHVPTEAGEPTQPADFSELK